MTQYACPKTQTIRAGPSRRTVSGSCVWLTGLPAWDERQYAAVRSKIAQAQMNGTLVTAPCCADLSLKCRGSLDARSTLGWTASELYEMAGRLAKQGRHSVALEWAWVAVETSVRDRLPDGRGSDLNFVLRLAAIGAPEVGAFFERTFDARCAEDAMKRLWRLRCDCVYEGKAASRDHSRAMLGLAIRWLRDVVGDACANIPIAPRALGALADMFRHTSV